MSQNQAWIMERIGPGGESVLVNSHRSHRSHRFLNIRYTPGEKEKKDIERQSPGIEEEK
jgi:hypothetical protein